MLSEINDKVLDLTYKNANVLWQIHNNYLLVIYFCDFI